VTTYIAGRPFAAVWVACLLILAGCVTVRTTGAESVDDFAAEEQYKAVYSARMTAVAVDGKLFAPTGSSPGVCNVGGSKQGCYDADTTMIQDLQAMLDALETTAVPPRFAQADELLKEALAGNIRGLQLRNQAIADSDNTVWKEHAVALEQALSTYQRAYEAFPADNRPRPPP
jgi:hypothetical protein